MRVLVIAVLAFLIIPSTAKSNQNVIAAMNIKCIAKMQIASIDGRPYLNKLKKSRQAREDAMLQNGITEEQVYAMVALFEGGIRSFKEYCECQSVEVYLRLPDPIKLLAAKVVAGEEFTPEEREEIKGYDLTASLIKLSDVKDFLQCVKP